MQKWVWPEMSYLVIMEQKDKINLRRKGIWYVC